MGEVYRARDTRLGREVAIKVITAGQARDPDRIKRLEQEARAAGTRWPLARRRMCPSIRLEPT
jgi:serine/threonine protein kinase